MKCLFSLPPYLLDIFNIFKRISQINWDSWTLTQESLSKTEWAIFMFIFFVLNFDIITFIKGPVTQSRSAGLTFDAMAHFDEK